MTFISPTCLERDNKLNKFLRKVKKKKKKEPRMWETSNVFNYKSSKTWKTWNHQTYVVMCFLKNLEGQPQNFFNSQDFPLPGFELGTFLLPIDLSRLDVTVYIVRRNLQFSYFGVTIKIVFRCYFNKMRNSTFHLICWSFINRVFSKILSGSNLQTLTSVDSIKFF